MEIGFARRKTSRTTLLTDRFSVNRKAEPDSELWRQTNVMAQKQKGFSLTIVVLKLGDIFVPQMRGLARIARNYTGGRMRTMVQQNILLPWIKNEHLPALHAELKSVGLGTAGALRLSDITRCPGSDTCQIAVPKSRGLTSAIGELFINGLAADMDMKDLHIKISGCTNSGGQHHIGNIGFFGTYRKVNGHEVPHYQLLIGGDIREGFAKFGQAIAAIPAKRTPDVVKHLITLYKIEKQGEERFVETMDRLVKARLKGEVEPFRLLPPFEEAPELYYEWEEHSEFKAEVGQGECAA